MFRYCNKIISLINKGFFIRSISTSQLHLNQTCIYALASGSQRSGLAVVRLSGKQSYDVLTQMTNTNKTNKPSEYEPRKMYLKEIINPVSKEKIDKGLVVWFKGSSLIYVIFSMMICV